jgi:hypothetical protein
MTIGAAAPQNPAVKLRRNWEPEFESLPSIHHDAKNVSPPIAKRNPTKV